MTFSFEKAAPDEFEDIRAFYWDVIDSMCLPSRRAAKVKASENAL